MLCPCRATNSLECVFPISFTQGGHVWFTLAMPRPRPALTMPFFSRPWHNTAVQRRPVGYLPPFGFVWLPCEVPRRLLSEVYQSSSQWSISLTIKSGSSALQKKMICWTSSWYFQLPRGLSRRTRHCRSRAEVWHGMCELRARHGMGTAWAQHGICESALK